MLVHLPVQVITEIKDWIGYTADQGVRPGECISPKILDMTYESDCVVVACAVIAGSLAALISGVCREGTEGPEGLLARLQLRLESHQSYGALVDIGTEEGRVRDSDDEEDDECECRDWCCCQGPTNLIKFLRLLLQTSLFFSSVIIMVNSFKDGEGGKEPGKS